MIFQDGYFYQRRLFYSTKWTHEMEATFVGALVEHKKHGNFKRNCITFHAVMSAIYDVNKEHSSRHSYTTGENKLQKLKERYLVFSSIITVPGVVVNKVGRYVIAGDAIWEKLTQERVLAKCYVNAYDDFYEGLCMLYGPNNADDEPTVFHEEEEVDSVASFYPPLGWVDDSPRAFDPNIMLANIYQLDTTSVNSTSLWRFLEEYYASDDEDEVNSMLALPAASPPSPNPSYVSVEHTSSSASNEINKCQNGGSTPEDGRSCTMYRSSTLCAGRLRKFKEDTYAWQLERLRKRYQTFKSILQNSAFEWDRENSTHSQNPFADAYLKRGEPKWDSLKLIFKRNEVGHRGNGH
ncbi:hypothetical protein Salat_1688900 [Sesamum alatum]|uniref:Myb/SANT-like domain-containing protein n=1 Tax=Sesamum alatum TaxID=300844 RepID=A0AAE2CJY1_9LAMI|nr:hypothetical protein Salat_1688900 [Sesamum alatum]